jgi:hypothetical protein
MSPARIATVVRLLAFVLVAQLLTAACYLPVHYTEPGSPMLTGTLLDSDGHPVAGARVAITPHTYDDKHCRRATVYATTDSAGRFGFQSTTVERKGIWLVPAIERFFSSYAICTGANDSTLHIAYLGRVQLQPERIPPDTVSCLQWIWDGRTRSVCSGSAETPVQTGGHWSDSTGSGYYRLIDSGPGWEGRESGVFLQWVQVDRPSGAETVRRTMTFPLAPKLLSVSARLVSPQDEASCVRVRSSGRPLHWYSAGPRKVDVSLELGPPGVTRDVPGCGDAKAGMQTQRQRGT